MGNLSSGRDVGGVPRTWVRLPGVLVHADICIPNAHQHAVWLLPWVEALLTGTQLQNLTTAPPWPAPPDALLARHLMHALIDLRWVVPDWETGETVVAPDLVSAFRSAGRAGLARRLFDAEVISGEWWAEGLTGTLLSRQKAMRFDWDHRRNANVVLTVPDDPQGLVDAGDNDLFDLIRKLGEVDDLTNARDRAFLATPLTVGERKDILFPMFGDDVRLLPVELAELEPVLARHAPELFGRKKATRSRVVRLTRSPVEQVSAEIERLPADPTALGPAGPVRERVWRLHALVERLRPDLESWIEKGHRVRPVVGPTQRHFDAIGEMCARLPERRNAMVLITSAFLSARNASAEDGLATSFLEAPDDTAFLVIYGHASDDLPAAQARDMEAWTAAMIARAPALTGRLVVVAGKRRSHEKVAITSAGDWMIGSWNAASSRPNALVFEASLVGRDTGFAAQLLERLLPNVAVASGESLAKRLAAGLVSARTERMTAGPVDALADAVSLLASALPDADGSRATAWTSTVRAVRAALAPFLATTELDLVDEQQTRDALVAHLRSARRDVLVASDRLADSGLDAAIVRDLRGDGASRRTVRIVWGREWAGQSTDHAARDQLKRAERTIRDAREQLGQWLCTSDEPMENHSKLLVVDGVRGMVTSENLLSYGGEKGRYESRELGVAFSSPAVARHLAASFLNRWPAALRASQRSRSDSALATAVTGNEVWHGLNVIADELDFDWRSAAYMQAALENESAERRIDSGSAVEAQPFGWVHEEAQRLGLVRPDTGWCPWDAEPETSAEALLRLARSEVGALPPRTAASGLGTKTTDVHAVHPLVRRVLAEMCTIPAGSFLMGDDRVRAEWPRHPVHISRSFLLGRVPVTQGLWEAVMGRLPHLRDVERHPDFPIIHVGYEQMGEFVDALNRLPGCGRFELPTEAQWEYACLAGADTVYCFGDDPGSGQKPGPLERYAWTKRNAGGRLQKVGQLSPNAFGLHDMHGLIYETMRDGPRKYTQESATDPIGPTGRGPIVARGGSWGRFPVDGRSLDQEHFRCASRQVHESSQRVGLRLACRIENSK